MITVSGARVFPGLGPGLQKLHAQRRRNFKTTCCDSICTSSATDNMKIQHRNAIFGVKTHFQLFFFFWLLWGHLAVFVLNSVPNYICEDELKSHCEGGTKVGVFAFAMGVTLCVCLCNHKLKNLSQGVICFLRSCHCSSLCMWVSDYGCCQKKVSG